MRVFVFAGALQGVAASFGTTWLYSLLYQHGRYKPIERNTPYMSAVLEKEKKKKLQLRCSPSSP